MKKPQTQREAQRRAKKLAGECGPEFKPHVWENIYWCYCANHTKAPVSVHVHVHEHGEPDASYTAYFNSATQFVASGPTAKAALQKVRAAARRHARTIHNDTMLLKL